MLPSFSVAQFLHCGHPSNACGSFSIFLVALERLEDVGSILFMVFDCTWSTFDQALLSLVQIPALGTSGGVFQQFALMVDTVHAWYSTWYIYWYATSVSTRRASV